MSKIAFIGAGSFEFTRSLVRDILTFPALQDCHIALMDVNAERLEMSCRAVDRIVKASGCPASIAATQDRREALQGADGVLITILAGGVDPRLFSSTG
jgi:alpha-galactosidase